MTEVYVRHLVVKSQSASCFYLGTEEVEKIDLGLYHSTKYYQINAGLIQAIKKAAQIKVFTVKRI